MPQDQRRILSGRLISRQTRRHDRRWRDECGLFGILDPAALRLDAARQTYLGLFALQHRGQDSAGIAVNKGGVIQCRKKSGLVVEAIDDLSLGQMPGHAAVGHVRYAAQDLTGSENDQPMLIRYRSGQIALGLNGSLNNQAELKKTLQSKGSIFQTGSAAEVLLASLAHSRIGTERIEEALQHLMTEISGAYALVLLTPDQLIGVRDPLGIRPLCLGRLGESWLLASESCAIDAVGGDFIRDVRPGEIVTLSADGLRSNLSAAPGWQESSRLCLFEYVYFARPDSILDSVPVQQVRFRSGCRLAEEQPAAADLVLGVPDSGLTAALGFARTSGIPYGQGILKNRYIGRSFIQPTPMLREISVTMKFSALRHTVRGKNIVLIDDSLVRGTTIRHLVHLLKQAGACSVHLRFASPPVLYPCFYGVDTPSQAELPACQMSCRQLCDWTGADSLAYLSLDGLKASTGSQTANWCSSCFDGSYPAGMPAGRHSQIRKQDRELASSDSGSRFRPAGEATDA